MAVCVAIVLALFSVTNAKPQQQAEPAPAQQAAEPPAEPSGQDAKPEASKQAKPKTPPEKKASKREPVKVVDIAPETATHLEGEPLEVEFKRLTALRIRDDDSLLASDAGANVIKIISPAGELVGTIDLPFAPEALDIAADGTLYCGGEGQLAKLNADGRVLKVESVPDDVAPGATEQPPAEPPKPAPKTKEHVENAKPAPEAKKPSEDTKPAPKAEGAGEESKPTPAAKEAPKPRKPAPPRRRRKPRPKRISGIAVTDSHVFVAFGSGWSLGSKSKLYRFDLELENPRALAEGLRGCCQRCDIKALNGVVYLAENSAHRVVLYDREGNVLNKWGERGRDDLKTFGACCNPMNICFDGQGILYTTESGLGRVKRYRTNGEFLDLVGYVGTERFWHGSGLAASCSNMAIAVTSDGRRVYVMDYKNNRIRVLDEKAAADEVETR
jgi:outer membrane biosynthesis protein TonB